MMISVIEQEQQSLNQKKKQRRRMLTKILSLSQAVNGYSKLSNLINH